MRFPRIEWKVTLYLKELHDFSSSLGPTRGQYEVDERSMWGRCEVDVRSMSGGCRVDVGWMWGGCRVDVGWM